jgi:hypothetical protein
MTLQKLNNFTQTSQFVPSLLATLLKFIDKQDIKMKISVFWLRLVRFPWQSGIGKGISVNGSTTSPDKISILKSRNSTF